MCVHDPGSRDPAQFYIFSPVILHQGFWLNFFLFRASTLSYSLSLFRGFAQSDIFFILHIWFFIRVSGWIYLLHAKCPFLPNFYFDCYISYKLYSSWSKFDLTPWYFYQGFWLKISKSLDIYLHFFLPLYTVCLFLVLFIGYEEFKLIRNRMDSIFFAFFR